MPAAPLLAEADSLHATGELRAAASAYIAYLDREPGDAQAWRRYADCQRAAGDLPAALLLYRHAQRLAPQDPLIARCVADALAALGRGEEAATLLAAIPGAAEARLSGVMLFDVSDLLDYFRACRTPTGIQRVQLNILREILATPGEALVAACVYHLDSASWKLVPPALFLCLAALSRSSSEMDDPDWQQALAAIAEAVRHAPPCRFAAGTSLVNLGSSWWQPGYMRRVADLKRLYAVRYIPFLYDCIPLLLPQHCAAALVDEFARWFAQLCLLADGVVVISDSTRRDFERLRATVLPDIAIPTFTLPLDADDGMAAEASAAAPAASSAPLAATRPYVLFVATIEARKNHLMVFRAWQRLLRLRGPEVVPDLICVGKRGWLAEPALELLEADETLNSHIRLLHGVPDDALAGLYRGCDFTLFNSFYEGWGLPVTESFAFGKVALVADNSSLPEAGAGGAVFFATDDIPDLVAKLEALLFQPGFRAAAEARLHTEVRLRPWSALATQLTEHVAAAARITLPARRLALRPGEVLDLRTLPGPAPHLVMAAAELVREGDNWLPLENWGCWCKPGRLTLRLPLAHMHGEAPLRVLVQFVAPPAPWRIGLRAGPASGITRPFGFIEGVPRQVVFCAMEVPPDAWPEVLVEIDAPTAVPLSLITPGDSREIGCGLLSLMVCRSDDFAARLDYLEQRSLNSFARV
jgi:glycosyltransferase involved in cell wall biosynthesis